MTYDTLGNTLTTDLDAGTSLYVGHALDGSLEISGGAILESDYGMLGYNAATKGELTITGGSSWINYDSLFVGFSGEGVLTIEDGSLVNASATTIARSDDSVGAVTVTGTGSILNTGTIVVGDYGTATLNIEDGGQVTNGNYAYIALSGGSVGTATVSGAGSTWTNTGEFYAGYFGNGTLNIEDGGLVEDSVGYLGYESVGTGTATVTGAGSIWANSSKLYIADQGHGTLTIQNGGVVSVGTEQPDGTFDGITYIGYQAGATGSLVIGSAAGDTATAAGALKAGSIKFGHGTGSIVFNHTDDDYDFSAEINGSGTISHLSGVTTLSGDNSNFSGFTNVTGGTLYIADTLGGMIAVSDRGTLGGIGTLGSTTIKDGGTLSPGYSGALGTLTVDGDLVLENGSTYAVDVTSASSDLISVTGTTTIAAEAGVSVTSLDASTSYQTAQTYSIINSAGTLTGTFDTVTSKSAFLDLTTSYDDNNAYLTVALKSTGGTGSGDSEPDNGGSGVFRPIARTANQRSVGSALDSLEQSGQSLELYNSLLLLSEDEALRTYEQLSGNVYGTARGSFIQSSRAVNSALNSRIRSVTGGVAAPSSMALGYAEEPRAAKEDDRFAAIEKQKDFDPDRFATWITGFGSWGKVSGLDGESDTDTSSGGVLVGGDVAIGDDWRVGVLGGYSRSFFDTNSSEGDSTNYHLGTYSGNKWGPVAFRMGVNYTWHDVGTTRDITALGQTLSGDYDASSLNAYGELAYRLDVGTSAFEPFAALAHTRLKTDGFAETGGSAALTVDSSTMDTSYTTIGLRTSTDFDLFGIASMARGTVGWLHAFGDVDPVSSARFVTGDSFSVSSTPLDRNAVLLEAGVDFTVTPVSTLSLTYNGQIGSNAYDHVASAKLRVKF
ncbi:autotransporter domain-containing protein [Rhizobium daejeonense]|uniref:Autotransporter domain-containing protein n=1 Tax=Rhizobium daejeonense TaxID=240521 RepID=A0A6M1S419_9HYPH|nr:autotransporter domain-containing protein [Rhizobium daejeonense]NGO65939.1 autotransporter domain-containing protein [Rhizobium daejeonense]